MEAKMLKGYFYLCVGFATKLLYRSLATVVIPIKGGYVFFEILCFDQSY